MDGRGRLTPVDVANFGVALFVFGLLIVPIYSLLNANVGALGTGDAYLFRMIVPGAILALFVVIMATAVQGQ